MDQIGNYRILEKIGEGGMGEVFKGIDTMLEREVAIKVVRPELSQRDEIVQRFRSEAVALGRLNHPNIVTVYAFARDGDRYYMALEFVNGESLARIIARHGRLPWQDAARYACAALAGLEHAHRLNVIHRDVKPANILVANTGMVKIMDFGIARILERARLTRQGSLVGTLEYASPEQIKGLDVDARSDIYSLGMVLYEMLTGRLPFRGDTEYELLKAQVEETPASPRAFAPDIPPELEGIVLRALAKKPADRFGSAVAFFEALHHVLERFSGGRQPPRETLIAPSGAFVPQEAQTAGTAMRRLGRWVPKHPLSTASALAALIAGGVALFFLSAEDPGRVGQPDRRNGNLSPAPAAIPEKFETRDHGSGPQPTAKAAAQITPVPTASPVVPTPVPPAEQRQQEVPAGILDHAPPPEDRQSPGTSKRKPTAAPKPARVKPRARPASPGSEADDNAEYWRNIDRTLSETGRSTAKPKPARRSARGEEEENARYWQNIGR